MSPPFPEPTAPAADRSEVLVRYLDYFREVLLAKLDGLPDDALRTSRLPSGWAPIEGRAVDDAWGDRRDDRWYVAADEPTEHVLAALRMRGGRSAAIVAAHDLGEIGQPGERWDGAAPPTLERILLHLLQEYARHVGHLDVVRELVDGVTGE